MKEEPGRSLTILAMRRTPVLRRGGAKTSLTLAGVAVSLRDTHSLLKTADNRVAAAQGACICCVGGEYACWSHPQEEST